MKKLIFKFLLIFLSTFFTYLLFFLYFYSNLEKDFEKNIKNEKNLYFYKKFSPLLNHIRYKDSYRLESKESKLIFDRIKNKSDKNIILFQGDSWFQKISESEEYDNYFKKNLQNFSQIINAGTSSYSPSLMHSQYNIIENHFKIKPNVVVIYIDQTDMGDELCRYRNLINFDEKGELKSVEMEKFPFFSDTFNLHEKISLSEIELKKTNKIIKTQLNINYKVKKSFSKIKKRFLLFFNDSPKGIGSKCHWTTIESYKVSLNEEEKNYFKKTISRYISLLNEKTFIKKIFIITHPHKFQLTTNQYPIDVSDIIETIIEDYKKVQHINFTKILKENKEFYPDFNTIWLNDHIHLNEQNYKKFFNKIMQVVNKN